MKYTPKIAVNPNIDTRSARGHLWVLIRLSILVIVGFYLVIGAAGWVGRRVPIGAEIFLFHRLSGLFVTGIEHSDSRYKLAAGVFEKLKSRSSLKDIPLDFRVIDSKDENAFAMPGGIVAVNTALVENAKSENELAMIIGHELGHVANRDVMSSLGRVLLMVVSTMFSGTEDRSAAWIQSGGLVNSAYSRSQESNADEFGLKLLVASYGGAAGAEDFFKRHLEDDKNGGPLLFRSHPLSTDRLSHLEELARKLGARLDNATLPLAK